MLVLVRNMGSLLAALTCAVIYHALYIYLLVGMGVKFVSVYTSDIISATGSSHVYYTMGVPGII
jgi:hypothetical protein